MKPQKIGTIKVPAGTITNRSYPTASWWTTFEHEEQTVDVVLGDNFVTWGIEGRTTFESFPSSFGGYQTGGGTHGPCDKPGRHGIQIYPYQAAELVELGELLLDDGFEVVERFHDHPISCLGHAYRDGRSVPCEHDVHYGANGELRNERHERTGTLSFGYTGETETKRHLRIVEKLVEVVR